ncbi:hypothetical protein SLE2022_251600 [Rubroshorea leprosula]
MDQSPKTQSKERKTIYPKVKVREQDQDDGEELYDQKRGYLMSLKDVQYLSLHDPAKENHFVSPMLVARIPKSYVPDLVRDSVSAAQGVEKDNKGDQEENRPNIRVSSIPPPRAVLSSPDNDEVIGNRNKIKAEHAPAAKNHNQGIVQNRHTIRGHSCSGNTINSRKSKDSADCNVNLSEKKDSGMRVSSQRRKVKTQRPAWQDP